MNFQRSQLSFFLFIVPEREEGRSVNYFRLNTNFVFLFFGARRPQKIPPPGTLPMCGGGEADKASGLGLAFTSSGRRASGRPAKKPTDRANGARAALHPARRQAFFLALTLERLPSAG